MPGSARRAPRPATRMRQTQTRAAGRRWSSCCGNSVGLALISVIFIDRLPVRPDPGAFATAAEHALWFQVGVFGLAFLLMLALPARRGHNPAGKSV
jgi:hypothetical protein